MVNRVKSIQKNYPVTDAEKIKEKVLNWVHPFSTFCFLDNHQYRNGPQKVECLVAAGVRSSLSLPAGNALAGLQQFIEQSNGWVFGHLGYELRQEVEQLPALLPDHVGFADLFFFEPEYVLRLQQNELIIEAVDPDAIFHELNSTTESATLARHPEINVQQRFSREEYIGVVKALQEHIRRGDCYEINFCQEFYAANSHIDPFTVFKKLSAESPNPFSALYRTGDQWLICASPERFIRKEGNRIISQPIKGTSRRVKENPEADRQQRENLYQSAKERAENVMVVDLVRNDLSRICREGTVQVDELFGVYSFPQVHQLISTISGELDPAVSFSDIIRAVFPMGSMTGAPKKRVMELIEQYEKTRRGIFSGSVGYIQPGGDFDFNVVIRSIMYNQQTGYVSFQAGSGITHYADPEAEWEECLLKAAAIKKVLGADASE